MKSRAPLLSALWIVFSASSHAQTVLPSVIGSVIDPTGAAITNAPITARNLETGTTISGVSSSTGIFSLTQMPIGKYDIKIERPGFKTYKREGISLSAAQVLRLDVTLEIGTPSEVVAVNAEGSLLKTDTSTVVHNITVSQIQNLPLTPVTANFPRDPLQVAQLIPGIRYTPQNSMFINGLPLDEVQYRVEGHVIGNSRTTAIPLTAPVQPSVDSIQEVAVQTSNYSAEFGSVGSGLLNFTMKSGTNQYHGSAFDYAVNEFLNAFNPGRHTRDRIRRHDWGATFGGAVRIPKIYDGSNKSFFFFVWEQFGQSQVSNSFPTGDPTVPTQAYRTGDFSSLPALSGGRNLAVGTRDYKDPLGNSIAAGTLFDPNNAQIVLCNTALSNDCGSNGTRVNYRTPLAGNRVPLTSFDPVAQAILTKYIPIPTGPRSAEVFSNYFVPVHSQKTTILPSIKFDHNFSTTTRLSFLYQKTSTNAPVQTLSGAEGFNDTITAARGIFESQNRYVLNADHAIAPTLQLHLSAAWTQFDSSDRALVTNYNPAEDIGLQGVKLNRTFPRFATTVATTTTGAILGGMNPMGPGLQQLLLERRPSANTSLTWVKNSHTVKLGADWRMDVLPTATFTSTAGNFMSSGFSGITSQPALGVGVSLTGASNTGFPFADWLLGSVKNFSMNAPIAYRTSKQQWGLYLEDTWRATRKLTLEYGLRWDLGTYAREDHGRNASLGLNVPNSSAGGHPGALIFEATCKCNIAQVYPYAIGPRLGFAYNWNSKTVFRGGFGVMYNSTGNLSGIASNSASAPTTNAGFDSFKMRDGIPASINPIWPNYDPALNHVPGRILPMLPGSLLDPNAGRPARTAQWNIGIQRELSHNIVVEASYVGNRGVWQSNVGMVDLNAVSVDQLAHYGFTVGNFDDANLLTTTFDRLSTQQKSTLLARGVAIPYVGFPIANSNIDGAAQTAATVFQSLRPYPQYSAAIMPLLAPLGRSWYDSLQISGTKRYSHGLMVNINYTLSKALSQTGAPDVFNRSMGKTYTTSNAPQQLRLIFEYQIPKFSDKTPILGNKWVNHAVAGWGVAAVMRYYSGLYLGRPASTSPNPITRWLQRGPGGAQLKKNSDGSYMSPWSVDWTDLSGKHHTDPLDINCHCFDPERTLVLNPSAWESIPDAQWSPDSGVLPFFRTQRTPSESANLSRNFTFGQDRRYMLQIRVEFQNVFNRVILPPLQISGLNFGTSPQKSTDGRYIGGFGTFGNLTGSTFSSPRSGQFVGRFTF